MTDSDIIQTLRTMRYPIDIDVVDAVMQQVRNKPLMVSQPRHNKGLRRFSIAAAACLLLAVGTNITLLYTRDYDEAQISNMIADVYNLHGDSPSFATAGYSFGAIENLY